MRIAVATRTLARVGGVEAYVERSAQGLVAAGHDVCVFPEDGARRAGGLDVEAWMPRSRSGASLAAAVRDYGPDVLVTHGLDDPGLEAVLATTIRPSVFFAHAYHGTCISGAKAHSWPGVRPCTRTLGPGCLVRYHARRCGGLNPVTMVREYHRQLGRLDAVRRHDRLFVISTHIAREYTRHGVPPDRIDVLPPPVPDDPHDRVEAVDPDHIVYLGRLERLKGPAVAVASVAAAAVKMQRPLRLTIAGEGSYAAEVQAAAAQIAPGVLSGIRFTGRLEPAAAASLLAQAGLVVVPSLWPEPFGLVGFEAAAHGVPVVAFDVGGIPEWLIDGATGHLASSFAAPVPNLRDAIIRSLADPAHYAALRRGAREAYAAAAARQHVGALARALVDVVQGAAS
jgi:glycosyltransferase involved in cell wall biosynthesis